MRGKTETLRMSISRFARIGGYLGNTLKMSAMLGLTLILLQGCKRMDSDTAVKSTSLIFIDGGFEDWASLTAKTIDDVGDGIAGGIDFQDIWAVSQNGWLLVRFNVNTEIVLQRNNSLTLFIDTDANKSTGRSLGDMGAELQWIFGKRRGLRYDQHGVAFPITPKHILISAAPTFSGQEFEVAIKLDTFTDGQSALFQDGAVRLILLDDSPGGDRIPNTQSIKVDVLPSPMVDVPVIPIDREHPSHFRIMQHNVLEDGIVKRGELFRRIYRAIDADVLLLGEVYLTSAEDIRRLLEEWIPLPDSELGWVVIKHQDGSAIASKYPIRQIESISKATGNGFIVDLPPPWDSEVYILHAWAACCDEDDLRQMHCDRIMAYLRNTLEDQAVPHGIPIILAGDFNLVTWRRHFETLRDGAIADTLSHGKSFNPDWDGASFTDLNPRHLAQQTNYTWRNDNLGFSPGRLDFIFYSASNLGVGNNFVFEDSGLPDSVLSSIDINLGDASIAADHYPVVGDFFPLLK